MSKRFIKGMILGSYLLATAIFATAADTNVQAMGSTIEPINSSGLAYTDKPDVRITRMNMPPVKAGEEFTLSLKLENISPAYSVNRGKLTLSVPDGISIMDQSNSFFIDQSGIPLNGSTMLNIKMKAGDKISTESLQIGATFEYTFWGRDGMASGSESYTILVPSKKTDVALAAAPIMQIVREKINPVSANKTYDLELKIKNIGKTKAENVKITFGQGAGFTVKTRASSKFIKEIVKGEPFILPVKIKTNKSIDTESLELTVNLNYSYDQGGAMATGTDSEKIIIPATVSAGEDGSMLTPNIIISKYDYGKKIEAGQNFDLSLSFKNTSKATEVENLVVSINTAEGVSIASSSNSFYFDKLKAGAEMPLKVNFKAWEEAKSAAAVITFNFNYEYKNAKSIVKGSTTENISIPVVQPDRFELGEMKNDEEKIVGQEITFSIPYVNKGKGTTSNISAKVEGEGFDCISKDIWVGNAASGASGNIDVILTPMQSGDITAMVKVEYEDPNGEKKSKDIEISFTADEPMIDDPILNPEDMPVEEKKVNPMVKLAIIAVIVIAIIAALVIVIKRLRKKAEAKRMERLSKMYEWANMSEKDREANRSDDK